MDLKEKYLNHINMNEGQLFENIIEFPNANFEEIYEGLVGLNEVKSRLLKESEILLNPNALKEWSEKKHGKIIPLIKIFENRHALFIFAGDVGTGKTTLAETFGDNLARKNKKNITLFRLSLNTRGTGTVGEMTRLISQAFTEIKEYAEQLKLNNGKYNSALILLIDEADALAQSRELVQMHHEDRAGVNALIRGIDMITQAHLPIITVMCTNRLGAIDPAVRRRAAGIFEFCRPSEIQRFTLFQNLLSDTGINEDEFQQLAKLTGENTQRNYGYTYSDITQNLLPALILDAYPDKEISISRIMALLQEIKPTPPFYERNNNATS